MEAAVQKRFEALRKLDAHILISEQFRTNLTTLGSRVFAVSTLARPGQAAADGMGEKTLAIRARLYFEFVTDASLSDRARSATASSKVRASSPSLAAISNPLRMRVISHDR
jgi:hypothetical protein